jgi:hypothetical protein
MTGRHRGYSWGGVVVDWEILIGLVTTPGGRRLDEVVRVPRVTSRADRCREGNYPEKQV